MANRNRFEGRVRVLQIVTFAVALGGTTAMAIFYAITPAGLGPNDSPMLSLIAAGLLAVQAVLSLLAPKFIVNATLPKLASQSPSGDEDRLLGLRQATHIVSIALLEGAVLFAAIAYNVERQPWTPMLAIAGIILIALRFPTSNDTLDWVETHQRRLAELRR